MIELDAINLCLRSIGSPTINEIADSDEQAATVQGVLKRVRREVLKHGWPFNMNKISLALDVSGKVPIDRSYLKYRIPGSLCENVSHRKHTDGGLYLWNIEDNEWYDKALDAVWVVTDIEDINDIPEPFGQWIASKAASEFFFDTNQQESPSLMRRWQSRRGEAVNSVCTGNLNEATGWYGLSVGAGKSLIQVSGHGWISVG